MPLLIVEAQFPVNYTHYVSLQSVDREVPLPPLLHDLLPRLSLDMQSSYTVTSVS